jgi:hypothetical protein
MEKIKNLMHLREEKMKLRVKELELEKSIRKDWSEIKENLRPDHLIKKELSDHLNVHWLANGLHTIANSLTRKLLRN